MKEKNLMIQSDEAGLWRDHFLAAADRGDAFACEAVAWEYSRGEYLERNIENSILYFDKLISINELRGAYCKTKMLFIEDDDRIESCIKLYNKYPQVRFFGAIRGIRGKSEFWTKGKSLQSLKNDGLGGHMPSMAAYYRYRYSKITRIIFFPYFIVKLMPYALKYVRNKEDPAFWD